MATPDYLICLDCETPCYDFEWHRDTLQEILCAICGNEDPDRFVNIRPNMTPTLHFS